MTTSGYVQQLAPDLRQTTGRPAAYGPYTDSPSIFQRGGRYYIVAQDSTGGFPLNTKTTYWTARYPLGNWTNRGYLSQDTCGGQPRTVAELPSLAGPVYVNYIDTWRMRDDTAKEISFGGDGNQALAGRHWSTLQFNDDGSIKPFPCVAKARIPLADGSTPTPAPSYEVDCRATQGSAMQQTFTVPDGETLRAVELPLFQHPNLKGDILAPLDVQVLDRGGAVIGARSLAPETLDPANPTNPAVMSFAPRKVRVDLDTPAHGGQPVTIRLTSLTPNGCYGALVGERTDPASTYSAGSTSAPKDYARAQLLFTPDYS
jgi:hypothetical protein